MQVWEDYVCSLEKNFGKRVVDEWVRSLKLLKFDACNLYFEAQDAFHASWIEEHLLPGAKKKLRNNNGHEIKIHLKVHGQIEKEDSTPDPAPDAISSAFSPDPLLPYCTYDQFAAGAKNHIPFQVLCKLTSQSDSIYNPIYLYGPSSAGKTHLLMSSAHVLKMKGLEVFYVHADTFTEHVVKAIRSGQMQKFRSAYRHIDALIIDDVQNFSRKNATQEELFHTFNTLHTAGKLIILSSPANPRQLEGIEERLVSRFEWGITLPLEKLSDPSELLEMIKKRLEFYSFQLKKETLDLLLSSFSCPATICQALESIVSTFNPQKGQILSHEPLLPLLQKLADQDQETSLHPEKILSSVADAFGIKVEDILSKSQSREIVLPRQLSMYLLRKELKMPFIKIGTIFSRDHSTVMSSIKQIAKNIEAGDKDLLYYLNDIQRKLGL